MSRITLTIAGHDFDLLSLYYKFHKDVDLKGRQESPFRNGFLYMEMESTESTFLFERFVTRELNMKPFAGKIEVLKCWDETAVRQLIWKEAYIIKMSERMDCFSNEPMITEIMISPIDLVINKLIYLTRQQPKTNGFWEIDPNPEMTPMRSAVVSPMVSSSLQKEEREPDVVRVFWRSLDEFPDRKDMMINHRIKLQIQLSNYIAGDYVQLVVKQSKGRWIKGNSTEFTISGRCDEKGLIVLSNFKVDCDFKEDNQDFEKIEFYYKGRLVETFDENFGWWYIVENGITKLFVMLNSNMKYISPGCTEGDYEGAIQEQFKRTLELSSGGNMTGKIFFNGPFDTLELPQATDLMTILEISEDSVGGLTYLNSSAALSQTADDGLLLMNLGETAVHELLHTLRLDHPHENTQTSDCELVQLSRDEFKTTPSTDPNIHYNIMIYGSVHINGKRLKDLWVNKQPEYLTKGQLNFIIQEIDRQKKGEGCYKHINFNYHPYWTNPPGKIIIQKSI